MLKLWQLTTTQRHRLLSLEHSFAEEYALPYDSELLNDTQRQQLTDTWGLGSGDEFAVYIGKRNVEGGPRASVMTNASFRVVLGGSRRSCRLGL